MAITDAETIEYDTVAICMTLICTINALLQI